MNEGLGIPSPMPRKHLEECKNEIAADICASIKLFLLFYNKVGLRQGPSSVFGTRFVAKQY